MEIDRACSFQGLEYDENCFEDLQKQEIIETMFLDKNQPYRM